MFIYGYLGHNLYHHWCMLAAGCTCGSLVAQQPQVATAAAVGSGGRIVLAVLCTGPVCLHLLHICLICSDSVGRGRFGRHSLHSGLVLFIV